MALALVDSRPEQVRFTFPAVGPRADEETRAQAMVQATDLLAHSLVKAIGMRPFWATRFVNEVRDKPPAKLVHTVLTTHPRLHLSSLKRTGDLESNLAATKAMVTAINAAELILQLALGIPSKKALKREALSRTRQYIEDEKAAGREVAKGKFGEHYQEELEKLKAGESPNQPENDLYQQRMTKLRQKTSVAHAQSARFRGQLVLFRRYQDLIKQRIPKDTNPYNSEDPDHASPADVLLLTGFVFEPDRLVGKKAIGRIRLPAVQLKEALV